ncbi:adenylyl-sulfate kinase [Polyangium jinanense]|uniref:Adenylyl-sulfate kinase n=1 Tax=Polyangium jinanense TaxID=2829994 RepID=A0A9X4ATM5_9BACT|nr:adenylyl-sulfate kinase [Polyangium jinanense]MDC3962020.1 adenylyl-sulfate kinase [Polyangium jinanense]MDC3982372.1 adenylyl-sulfate kinase [Polyangium jinanense]
MSGFVVWFTGLSGAGKSTLGALLAAELRTRGVHVEVLDGDEVRTHLSKGLGFSREDRDTNVRRIGFVAKLVARSGACAITGAISPFRAIRDEQRAQIERFVEVYCSASIDALADRDPKGLYRKALAGEIKGFTGIDDPYEPPASPEVTVYTDRESKEESLARIVARLEELGYVPALKRSVGRVRAHLRPPLGRPHGGELRIRATPSAPRGQLAEYLRSKPVIDLDAEAEIDVALFATGALSPLRGFFGEKDFLRVAREMRLENGLAWPMPITLPVSEEVAGGLRIGAIATLRARDGRTVAMIEVNDVYRPPTSLASPLGEEDPDLARALTRGPVLVGGEVSVFEPNTGPSVHGVGTTRRMFMARGLTTVAGIRARSLPRRAEEHLAKVALEITGGLWVQAIEALEGDGEPEAASLSMRLRSHEVLVERYFPAERVVLSAGLPARRGGGRQAVLDAIVCQNHGCSHAILVGSTYAGGVSGAERAFRVYAPGELGVVPLCFEDAFHSTRTNSMATSRSAPGDASTWITLTEAEILAMIARGEAPPPEVLRPEVFEVLAAGPRSQP